MRTKATPNEFKPLLGLTITITPMNPHIALNHPVALTRSFKNVFAAIMTKNGAR